MTVSRNSMRFFRGMGLGMLAGATAGVTLCCCMKRRKGGFKRRMSKALRNMGDLVENVGEMF